MHKAVFLSAVSRLVEATKTHVLVANGIRKSKTASAKEEKALRNLAKEIGVHDLDESDVSSVLGW